MARAHLYENVQIGVESTKGTAVSANKRLPSLTITPQSRVDIAKYRPSGYKFSTIQTLNREWTEARIRGPITYNELPYLLCSLIKNVAPTGAGDEKEWVFAPTTTAADTRKTYTVEYGSATRAEEFSYGIMRDLTMRFNNSGAELEGVMLGQAITDGITMTSTPTDVDLVPVTRPTVTVELASTAAALGSTPLGYPFSVEWALTNTTNPLFVLDGTRSFKEEVDIEPQLQVKLTLMADNAGTAMRTVMRDGAFRFMRIHATGPTIDNDPYELTIDTALKVISEPSEPRDQDGATVLEWTFEAMHDATWGKATEITVVNELTAL